MTVKTTDKITRSLQRIEQKIDQLPKQAFDYWVKITPKLSGNARQRTRFARDKILAQYPYAERLDQGYSKKAPQGMSQPTQKFIDQEMRKLLRK